MQTLKLTFAALALLPARVTARPWLGRALRMGGQRKKKGGGARSGEQARYRARGEGVVHRRFQFRVPLRRSRKG